MSERLESDANRRAGPLTGVKVLEAGPVPAGTIAGSLLADFGAEVIRLTKPLGDDPEDAWWGGEYTKDGVYLPHKVQDRNKLMAGLDLSQDAAIPIFRELIERADVFLSNFRPGRLEEWGVGPDVLLSWNPNLVVCLLSAFGQTGPYRDRPADGRIAEAFGGHAYLNGMPDGAPLHSQMDIGGSLAGSWCAMGIVFGLYWRDANGGEGQIIDIGLYEPLFRQIQQQVTNFVRSGEPDKRRGNLKADGSPWVATHETADGAYFTFTAATKNTMRDHLAATGLSSQDRFRDVAAVNERWEEYHEAVTEWMGTHTSDEIAAAFAKHAAAGTRVMSAADLVTNEQILSRDLLVEIEDPKLGKVRMQGIVPKLSETPGRVGRAGVASRTDNRRVYEQILGKSEERVSALEAAKII